ncbi:MAG: hypothetical protein WA718_12930 [Terriglobales bacterium]
MKKPATQRKAAAKSRRPVKKTVAKKLNKKKTAPKKKAAVKAKTPRMKKAAAKTPRTKIARTKIARSKSAADGKRAPRGNRSFETEPFPLQGFGAPSGGQSGDDQGLSNVEDADSESVEELVDEGNAFEADVVSGVERAGDEDEKEVRTHEVPEDDVPEEYLDEE